jgi:hypothetical protein
LNSFYLDDLDRLVTQSKKNKQFGKALTTYLGTPLPEDKRIDILKNNGAMASLASVTRLPKSRWPASPKHPLVSTRILLARRLTIFRLLSPHVTPKLKMAG